MVNIGIITIGDEILIGQIVDTNSAWLGSKLSSMGYRIREIVSISDNREAITSTLTSAMDSNDITIVTGGLGPTKDDITKRTLADIFECDLIKNSDCFEAVRQLCERRGLDFNELNQAQGYVPSCCEAIVNNFGTAPAMIFTKGNNTLISLPGVPFELKELCQQQIFKIIGERYPASKNLHITKTVYGLPESTLALTIADWENALPSYMSLAYLPTPQRVRLRISTFGEGTVEEIEHEFSKLKDIIPNYYIGDESMSIEASAAQELISRGETLAIAESCTGGAVASRFTLQPGASQYLIGGVIAYSNSIKSEVLGVKSETLERYGAVSEETAAEMAEGVRQLSGATYGVATTGIAGPDGGTADKPVGTVCFAIATPSETITAKKIFTTLREQNIEYASSYIIGMLRSKLLNH